MKRFFILLLVSACAEPASNEQLPAYDADAADTTASQHPDRVALAMAGGWLAPPSCLVVCLGSGTPFLLSCRRSLSEPVCIFSRHSGLRCALVGSALVLPNPTVRTQWASYELLGVASFRAIVPDGDLAKSWQRRHNPNYRIIPNRQASSWCGRALGKSSANCDRGELREGKARPGKSKRFQVTLGTG